MRRVVAARPLGPQLGRRRWSTRLLGGVGGARLQLGGGGSTRPLGAQLGGGRGPIFEHTPSGGGLGRAVHRRAKAEKMTAHHGCREPAAHDILTALSKGQGEGAPVVRGGPGPAALLAVPPQIRISGQAATRCHGRADGRRRRSRSVRRLLPPFHLRTAQAAVRRLQRRRTCCRVRASKRGRERVVWLCVYVQSCWRGHVNICRLP